MNTHTLSQLRQSRSDHQELARRAMQTFPETAKWHTDKAKKIDAEIHEIESADYTCKGNH